jgi:hypothetical protein
MTKEIRMPKQVPVAFRHLCFVIPSSFGNSIFGISTQASAHSMLTAQT